MPQTRAFLPGLHSSRAVFTRFPGSIRSCKVFLHILKAQVIKGYLTVQFRRKMKTSEFTQQFEFLRGVWQARIPPHSNLPSGFQLDLLLLFRQLICFIGSFVTRFNSKDDIKPVINLILEQTVIRFRMDMSQQRFDLVFC